MRSYEGVMLTILVLGEYCEYKAGEAERKAERRAREIAKLQQIEEDKRITREFFSGIFNSFRRGSAHESL